MLGGWLHLCHSNLSVGLLILMLCKRSFICAITFLIYFNLAWFSRVQCQWNLRKNFFFIPQIFKLFLTFYLKLNGFSCKSSFMWSLNLSEVSLPFFLLLSLSSFLINLFDPQLFCKFSQLSLFLDACNF